jgi:hypothetical protein
MVGITATVAKVAVAVTVIARLFARSVVLLVAHWCKKLYVLKEK